MRKKYFLKNRGMAIIVVMVFTVILLILGVAFLKVATLERFSSNESLNLNQAFYLAEAGLERGKEWLNSTSTSPTSSIDPFSGIQSYGGGTYQVTIAPLATNQYEVSSTGKFGNPTIAKTLNIIMQIQSIFVYAVFGDENISLRGNARIDSYDSENGNYGGGNVNSDGNVGTNAIATVDPYSIYLSNNAQINGNATIGPGGETDDAIEIRNNSEITGTQSSANSPQDLPEVIAPTGLTDQGSITLTGNSNLTLNTSGEYSSIQLNSNSHLTLDGDLTIYITGTLSLNSNSQVIITEGSDVTIYLAGSFSQSSNSQINNLSEDPTTLSIYGTDALTSVNWASNSDFYGAFYAPNADVEIHSNAEIYGSIIANTVDLASNARVHYDEALADETDSIGSGYKMISWEEEPAIWE
ncbi:hypothetical protein KAS42_03520 [bacterium]|nr:hypothetical protein [bacterium]